MFGCCKGDKSPTLKRTFSVRENKVKAPRLSTADPDMVEWTEQMSQGDQSYESRVAFWNGGMGVCIKCGNMNIEQTEEQSGVRTNGDAYGVVVFRCSENKCGWNTSFDFDDGSIDCWHYEANGWPRGIKHYPVIYMMRWAEKHRFPGDVTESIRKQRITGNYMLELDQTKRLETDLGITKPSADKIHMLLRDKFGAILTSPKKR